MKPIPHVLGRPHPLSQFMDITLPFPSLSFSIISPSPQQHSVQDANLLLHLWLKRNKKELPTVAQQDWRHWECWDAGSIPCMAQWAKDPVWLLLWLRLRLWLRCDPWLRSSICYRAAKNEGKKKKKRKKEEEEDLSWFHFPCFCSLCSESPQKSSLAYCLQYPASHSLLSQAFASCPPPPRISHPATPPPHTQTALKLTVSLTLCAAPLRATHASPSSWLPCLLWSTPDTPFLGRCPDYSFCLECSAPFPPPPYSSFCPQSPLLISTSLDYSNERAGPRPTLPIAFTVALITFYIKMVYYIFCFMSLSPHRL